MGKFELRSDYKPCGDQSQAIEKLTKGIRKNLQYQTLLGVTGSGKTFTMAKAIENVQRPTLIISPNKTLCAQLYREFKEFFPQNAAEYFVSYYDYYQPEAYIPQTDTYIEKDASINEEIDKLRLSATSSLIARDDVIIVASVSCIYNLGSPGDYSELLLFLEKGDNIKRRKILEELVSILYGRNDTKFTRGKFRVRGDIIEIFPSYEEKAIRVELFGDEIEKLSYIDPLTGNNIGEVEKVAIYPAKHFLTTSDKIERALISIKEELKMQLEFLRSQNKLLEAQRLESRTKYDMEMLKEVGYCHGIENYSRHLSGRLPGSRSYCLIDYFGDDFIVFIDESHVTVPQIKGMYKGDKARKEVLVEHGFRLPSALDNRPLRLDEFEELVNQTIYISATPSDYEIEKSKNRVVEQIIRPTGLIDPEIEVKPTDGQIDDLVTQINQRAKDNERILVTTLTKRMAEDLSVYLKEIGIKVNYIHSEIDTITRVEILRDLRLKKFDCLVGINLLREGLDLPEVSLIAILDADKEGFLRSETSLIQVSGRAARNVNGKVIMYADNVTNSMKKAIQETNRRRRKQMEFNRENNITPKSIQKEVKNYIESRKEAEEIARSVTGQTEEEYERDFLISELERRMELAARNLQFEKAVILRDKIKCIKQKNLIF